MKEQKARVDNNYVLQTTILRQVIKDYKSFIASLTKCRANPKKQP
jgi:hypothetical protein